MGLLDLIKEITHMSIDIKGIAYDITKNLIVALVVAFLMATEPTAVKSMEMNTPEQVKSSYKFELSIDVKYESEK